MTALYVLYDDRCGLCTWLSEWLSFQRVYVPVVAIAADGRIWRNHAAWLAVLWALRDYRRWARRLASPAMLLLARHSFFALSKNRFRLWHMFRVGNDHELSRGLSQEEAPSCQWNG